MVGRADEKKENKYGDTEVIVGMIRKTMSQTDCRTVVVEFGCSIDVHLFELVPQVLRHDVNVLINQIPSSVNSNSNSF